jgi:hypothetical protein
MRLSVTSLFVFSAALGLVFVSGCEQQSAENSMAEVAAVTAEAVAEVDVDVTAEVALTSVEAAEGMVRFDVTVTSENGFDGFQFKVVANDDSRTALTPTVVKETALEGINVVAGPAGVIGFAMGTIAEAGTHRVATFTVPSEGLSGLCVSGVSLNTPQTNEAGQRIAKVVSLADTCTSL